MLLRWRIFNYSWRSYVAHGDLWRRRSEKHFGVEMMDYILICDDFDWCCKNLHTFVLHDVIVSINLIDIKNRFVSSKTTQLRKDADICAMGRVVHWIEISPVNTLVSQEFPPLQLPVPHFRWHAQAIEGFVKSSGGDYFFSYLVYCRPIFFLKLKEYSGMNLQILHQNEFQKSCSLKFPPRKKRWVWSSS